MNIENEYLNKVVTAFKTRSKAIKHRGCKINFSYDNENGLERLNIDGEYLDTPPVQIRLSIWDDGEIYYRTCQSQKIGWKHKIELSGNVSGIKPEQVESLFESGIHIKDDAELLNLWRVTTPKLK